MNKLKIKINEYMSNLNNFFSITIIAIIIIFPFVIIVYSIWEFEVLDFSNNKNLYLFEEVTVGGSIFKKYHKINFSIFPETQTIIQTNEHPTFNENLRKYYKPINMECLWRNNKRRDCESYKTSIDADKKSYARSLPKFNKSMTKLENCLIKNEDNWICKENINHVNTSIKYFGLHDGDWITDESNKNKISNWKIHWYYKNLTCDEICYVTSVTEREAKHKEAQIKHEKTLDSFRTFLRKQRSKQTIDQFKGVKKVE